jgi:hypothetical protein
MNSTPPADNKDITWSTLISQYIASILTVLSFLAILAGFTLPAPSRLNPAREKEKKYLTCGIHPISRYPLSNRASNPRKKALPRYRQEQQQQQQKFQD